MTIVSGWALAVAAAGVGCSVFGINDLPIFEW
jgi:hypothetical protein